MLCILTSGTLYVLTYGRKGSPANIPLILTSILMYLLATAQIVIDTTSIFQAFISLDRAARKARLADISIPVNATKRAIFFGMMILGDAIAIYRCYIIWLKNWWLIAIPSACSLISAILAYMTIWATQHPEAGNFILSTPWTYGTAIFVLSLVANAIATSLVAYRIWSNEREFNKTLGASDSGITRLASAGRSRLLPIARIVFESGLLNTAYLIVYITVLQVQKGQGSLPIVADMASPLVGLIFSLVIVRIGIKNANRTAYSNQFSTLRVKQGPVSSSVTAISRGKGHIISTSSAPQNESVIELGPMKA
ncbi:hypothetical protein H0H92_003602 [Tricholoma furcatifolium]|nr:hypothetical protein H0H92_003602 [Tricholoma furcatifolium]